MSKSKKVNKKKVRGKLESKNLMCFMAWGINKAEDLRWNSLVKASIGKVMGVESIEKEKIALVEYAMQQDLDAGCLLARVKKEGE